MEESSWAQPEETARAIQDRESEAVLSDVASRFAECAKVSGARIGPNGWARCVDVPADPLVACLDPLVVPLAVRRISIHRILNEIRDAIERTRPPACFPFMPFELFDPSSPVRVVIVERIRQAVKKSQ